MWSKSPVLVHTLTAFVGKHRFENDIIAVPPGFNTRLTSFIISSGFVR
jgi:hypothetical protein